MPLDSWLPPPPPRITVQSSREPTAPARGGHEPDSQTPKLDAAQSAKQALPTEDFEIRTHSLADPVSTAADAAFAELGTQAALQQALSKARSEHAQRQKAADHDGAEWPANIELSGRALHALMGVDDPLALGAHSTYDESPADLELRAALRALPETDLASGELAALDAFDMALGEGADMEEALSAAIAAAEAAGGPDWAAPKDEGFLSPTPSRQSLTPVDELDSGLALAGEIEGTPPRAVRNSRTAADPVFEVRLESLAPFGGLADGQGLPGEAPDPAFGLGFDFGADTFATDTPLDFERRLLVDRQTTRRDVTTTTEAAASSDLFGTDGADLLAGGSGIDIIGARSGDDYLYGDTPTNLDTAVHDAASPLTNPSFGASGGADVMSGGAGSDSLWGGAGADRMHGDIPDSGSTLATEFGFDLGTAGFGDDALWGGDGADSLWGGEGNDTLYGEADSDTLYGGDGNDTLYGGDAADRLEGNAGVDTLYGQAGADNLFGYAGDDVLAGGEGDDTLAGGDGADEFQFSGGSGADALARAQSLGIDTISDYSAADGDVFGLSDADFGLGSSGALTDGDTYFEYAQTSLSATPLDASSGDAGPAVVVFGANSGTDGVDVYYTEDASAMTNANSYQIADIVGVNMTDIEAGDFFGRS